MESWADMVLMGWANPVIMLMGPAVIHRELRWANTAWLDWWAQPWFMGNWNGPIQHDWADGPSRGSWGPDTNADRPSRNSQGVEMGWHNTAGRGPAWHHTYYTQWIILHLQQWKFVCKKKQKQTQLSENLDWLCEDWAGHWWIKLWVYTIWL